MFSSRPLLSPVASRTASNFDLNSLKLMSRPSVTAGMQRDPHGQNVVHFHLDDFPRQAELRNTEIEHSAWHRGGLEDFNRVAKQGQVMSASKAANTRADDGDLFIALGSRRQPLAGRVVSSAQVMAIGGVALQCADGDRFVDFAAPAIVFAGVRADTAQNVCERIGGAGQQVRFLILRDPDGLHVAPAFGMNRTSSAAGNILVEVFPVRNRDGVWHVLPAQAIEYELA
jgi:hypothetical protein